LRPDSSLSGFGLHMILLYPEKLLLLDMYPSTIQFWN